MEKYSVTYNVNKPRQLAVDTVNNNAMEMLDSEVICVEDLKRVLQPLAYCALFTLPEHLLENNKTYAIENIVYHIPGIYKQEFHDLLICIGNIVHGEQILQSVIKILENPFIPELLDVLGVNIGLIYGAILYYYSDEVKCDDLVDDLHKIYEINPNYTRFYELYNFYKDKVV